MRKKQSSLLREETTARFGWSKLNRFQLGRFGEYLLKMELTKLGFSVFAAEVDDRGIDFILRTPKGKYYEVQTKTLYRFKSVYLPAHKVPTGDNFLIGLVLLSDESDPEMYLIPFLEAAQTELFVKHGGGAPKSKPAWWLNLADWKPMAIEGYRLNQMVAHL